MKQANVGRVSEALPAAESKAETLTDVERTLISELARAVLVDTLRVRSATEGLPALAEITANTMTARHHALVGEFLRQKECAWGGFMAGVEEGRRRVFAGGTEGKP